MNSNFGNLDFDLGLGSNRSSRSLNDQKNKSNSFSYTSSSNSSFSQPKPANTTPSWQPGKPSWTHQPAPSQPSVTRTELGGPTSMVGDIFGKSWNSMAAPSSSAVSSTGIVNKNPNLFGDLVSSALGQNKGNNNAPLKSSAPVKSSSSSSSSFSMGGMANSLPKTNNSVNNGGGSGSWGSSQNFGSFVSATNSSATNKSPNLGGPLLKSVGCGGGGGGGIGMGMSSNKDPFGSLVGFGSNSKPMGGVGVGVGGVGGGGLNSAAKPASTTTKTTTSDDFAFGDFQNASKSGSSSASVPKMDSFFPQNQTPVQSSAADSFDMLFPSSSATGGTTTAGEQQFSGGDDDWGIGSEFGGGHDGGSTTELDGLPPPPAGVSPSTAKAKGLDNYKAGQYADAIKWLSWAELLLEKAGDGTTEVLTCRASCYKEVGEYKKAVADCTKVLDHDENNVSVLVQRALLYESMEKYRLGADDLRTVLKLDPSNRVARSTIHRLNKMAD